MRYPRSEFKCFASLLDKNAHELSQRIILTRIKDFFNTFLSLFRSSMIEPETNNNKHSAAYMQIVNAA